MSSHKVHVEFPGRILIVGFGSIGQGILPLILRHVGVPPERVSIVTADERGRAVAAEFGVKLICETLTRQSFRRVLNPLLGRGDFLLNVSVDVASTALIKLCWEKGAMYLDTCIEPWPGGYTDPTVPAARRTNYALREEALKVIASPFKVLDAAVVQQSYLLGNEFTVADLNVAAVISRAVDMDLSAWPHLKVWLARCLDRPAARDALALKNKADAETPVDITRRIARINRL